MSEVASLFSKLLYNYVAFGWPFLVLHFGVLALSIWTWADLHREIFRLKRWSPGLPPGDSQATQILHQFITETEKLGPQGFFVPITDFSDRLDSIIGGRVTELYERINLFLIVGIAGTMFGIFEFASGAADVLGNDAISSADRVVRLGEILSASLAKAFPVGFVGLGLMFLGQIGVSIWENRFKMEVAKATSGALQHRMKVSQTQAQVVARAAASIETALAPMQNFQVMMIDTLRPVVELLAKKLDDSLGLVKEQFGQLETTTAGFSSAVAGLRDGVTGLEETTKHIGALLQHTPEILDRLGHLQRDQEQALQVFRENLRTSLAASERTLAVLESATQSSRDLPDRILTAAQDALKMVSQDTTRVSSEMAETVRHQLTTANAHLSQHLIANSETLFGGVKGQTEALQSLIQTTGEQLTGVGTAARDAVAGIQEVRKDVHASLEASLIDMRQESGRHWESMTDNFGRQTQSEFLRFIEQIRSSVGEIRVSLDGAARSWGNVAVNAETMIHGPINKVLDDIGGELRRAVKDIDSLMAERYPKAVEDVHEFTSGLQKLVSQARGVQDSLDRWLDSLDRARQGMETATRTFREQLAQPPRPVERPDLAPVIAEMRRIDHKLDMLNEPRSFIGRWFRSRKD